jgi:hypothetical protein
MAVQVQCIPCASNANASDLLVHDEISATWNHQIPSDIHVELTHGKYIQQDAPDREGIYAEEGWGVLGRIHDFGSARLYLNR